MPGAYAHITLVNILKTPDHLESLPGFDPAGAIAVLKKFKFCELGVVSPDYPYLVPLNQQACSWADAMHYKNTGDMIKAGIRILAQMQRGDDWRKAFAWLCGYAAHVGTDMTIHPVVERKVGPYAQNKTDHRVCEMHQDAYIFQRLNLGGIGLAEHLDSGIWGCCDTQDSGRLDPAVAQLWKAMLKACHPEPFVSNPPDLDQWHTAFKAVVDDIAEEGNKLFPAARHLAVNCGLTYPEVDEIDSTYIVGLDVPGGRMDYDQVFDTAIENVKTIWSLIWKGVFKGNKDFEHQLGQWNLDTGRDDANQLVFWRPA
jgi:hypothetical protein